MGDRPTTALVTGYIPIQGHPRTAAEYGELGQNMFGALQGDFYVHPFYETIGETWLTKAIRGLPNPSLLMHSVGDNGAKNTLAYHCVQHQKFAWLLKAKLADPSTRTFVWMDYGIGHVPGVTPAVVNDFMAAVKPNDFAIPGCLERDGLLINDSWPCWRFCGGLLVVPATHVYTLYKTVKDHVVRHMKKANNVTWEVNALARVEPHLPGLRWYKADHNETMFTHYGEKPCDAALLPASVDQSAATSTLT